MTQTILPTVNETFLRNFSLSESETAKHMFGQLASRVLVLQKHIPFILLEEPVRRAFNRISGPGEGEGPYFGGFDDLDEFTDLIQGAVSHIDTLTKEI